MLCHPDRVQPDGEAARLYPTGFLFAGTAQPAPALFTGQLCSVIIISHTVLDEDALTHCVTYVDMVRGIARDVGAEVDHNVAFVVRVIVVSVDAGNGIAKAAVLLNAKPGTGDDQEAVGFVHLAADAGREGETTGTGVEVGEREGDGGIEVVQH